MLIIRLRSPSTSKAPTKSALIDPLSSPATPALLTTKAPYPSRSNIPVESSPVPTSASNITSTPSATITVSCSPVASSTTVSIAKLPDRPCPRTVIVPLDSARKNGPAGNSRATAPKVSLTASGPVFIAIVKSLSKLTPGISRATVPVSEPASPPPVTRRIPDPSEIPIPASEEPSERFTPLAASNRIFSSDSESVADS